MSVLIDGTLLRHLINYKPNTYKHELTKIEKLVESLKKMPKKNTKRLIEKAIIKEFEEELIEPREYILFSDIAKIIGTQCAKELLLMMCNTARIINIVIDIVQGDSRDLLDRCPLFGHNLLDYTESYFSNVSRISRWSETYEKENSIAPNKDKHTREYLDLIADLLMELRANEEHIHILVGPYTWIVRKKLFPYPDPAKKFVTIYRGQKTEHSYERDWLPL